MRKAIIILFCLNFLNCCNSKKQQERDLSTKNETSFGVGVVEIIFDDKTKLIFYENSKSKIPARTLEFFNDTSINSYSIRNLENQQKWLKPEIIWLDYFSFVFRCKSQNKDFYEVIVNNKSGETLWLKKSKATKFKTWEDFLTNMFGIRSLPNEKQQIRKLPNDNSIDLGNFDNDCYKVKSMRDEWIEIYTSEDCEDETNPNNLEIKAGWIKWRTRNKLLIEYFITS